LQLRDMMYVSLFTAIVGVMAFFPPIPIPFIPVPITAQTLGVMLAGGLLGARRGGLSLLIFILLVAVGAPLLAGGRGGLGLLFGPGGGYILAWPLAAFIIGYLTEKTSNRLTFWKLVFFNVIGGVFLVYLVGVTYLSILSKLPWGPTFVSSFVFIPGDMVKVFIASYITMKLRKAYPSFMK